MLERAGQHAFRDHRPLYLYLYVLRRRRPSRRHADSTFRPRFRASDLWHSSGVAFSRVLPVVQGNGLLDH